MLFCSRDHVIGRSLRPTLGEDYVGRLDLVVHVASTTQEREDGRGEYEQCGQPEYHVQGIGEGRTYYSGEEVGARDVGADSSLKGGEGVRGEESIDGVVAQERGEQRACGGNICGSDGGISRNAV